MQAKLLIERTAFVGHSFAEPDADVVSYFKAILGELSVRCLSGEAAEAKSVSDKVKERIRQAETFVGIFTRRDKLEGRDEWNTGPWVIEEKAHAETLGKKLILLREVGVSHIGGMQGDYEYIEFDRAALHKATIRLMQTVLSLNPGKLAFNQAGGLGVSMSVLEAAVGAQPHEPNLRVLLAKQYIATGRHDAAVREIQSVLSTYPDFAPARLELIKGYRGLGSIAQAVGELERLLKGYPLLGDAHHQKAHILEQTGDMTGAVQAYRTAIDCEPTSANHYQCLGKLLFRTARGNNALLQDAKKTLEIAASMGDQAIAKDSRAFLEAIEKSKALSSLQKSKRSVPNRPAKPRRKGKRK